jgi:hypothetical protein
MGDVPRPDRIRRDIWWVDRDGDNLSVVLDSTDRVVPSQSARFFARFGDPARARRHLALWAVTSRLPGAPFNIGRPGSPTHQRLLTLLNAVIRSKTAAD